MCLLSDNFSLTKSCFRTVSAFWTPDCHYREDESREVSHHGTMIPAAGKQGGDEERMFNKPRNRKIDLIARDEKIQVQVRK